MAFETLGLNMVVKGTAQFSRDIGYVASALSRYYTQVDRLQKKLIQLSATEIKVGQQRAMIAYKTYQSISQAANNELAIINKLYDAWGRRLTTLARVQAANIAVPGTYTPAQVGAYTGAVTKAYNDMSDAVARYFNLTGQAKTAAANVTQANNAVIASMLKQQASVKGIGSGFGTFFSMLTGGFGKTAVATTAWGGVLAKLVPQVAALTLGLDVLKLGVDAVIFGFKLFLGALQALWNIASRVITVVWNIAKAIGGVLYNALVSVGKKVWDTIIGGLKSLVAIPYNIVKSGFEAIGNAIKNMTVIAMGMSFDRVIWSVGSKIKELGSMALDAASEFQLLQVRMQALLMRQLVGGETNAIPIYQSVVPTSAQIEQMAKLTELLRISNEELAAMESSGAKQTTIDRKILAIQALEKQITTLNSAMTGTYKVMKNVTTGEMSIADATPIATQQMKELTYWISVLAVKSKFNAATIADALTLALSYSFNLEEAKQLVMDITSYATGMGLGQQEFTLITENFGQMIMAGKLTGTELRDLARGAFMPVNRLLQIMGEALKLDSSQILTLKKSLQDMTSSGEISLDVFFEAFHTMVAKDFPNVIESASTTWSVVQSNIQDFIQSIIGWRVITPTLDLLSRRVADFLLIMMSPEMLTKWESLGSAVAGFVNMILGLSDKLGGTQGIYNWLGKFLDSTTNFLNVFKDFNEGKIGRVDFIARILDVFKINDPGAKIDKILQEQYNIPNAIGPINHIIQDLWDALDAQATLGGKAQVIWDFLETKIWPIFRDYITDELWPKIKNLIMTTGTDIWVGFSDGAVVALNKIRDWFDANSAVGSVFYQFFDLISSIMGLMGASINPNRVTNTGLPESKTQGATPYYPDVTKQNASTTASSQAMESVTRNWEILKQTLISIAKDGLGVINQYLTSLYSDIGLRVDIWLIQTQTPWGNLRDVLINVRDAFGEIWISVQSLIDGNIPTKLWALIEPLGVLAITLAGIKGPKGGELASWGEAIVRFVDTVGPVVLAIENIAAGMFIAIKTLWMVLRTAYDISRGPLYWEDVKTDLENIGKIYTEELPTIMDNFSKQWEKYYPSEQANKVGQQFAHEVINGVATYTPILGTEVINLSGFEVAMMNKGSDLAQILYQGIQSGFAAGTGAGQTNALGMVWGSTTQSTGDPFYGIGYNMVNGLGNGMAAASVTVIQQWRDTYPQFDQWFTDYYILKSPSVLMQEKGKDFISGLWIGMKDEFTLLLEWWGTAVIELATTFDSAMQMASPSKLFETKGGLLMEGLARGISKGAVLPWAAMSNTPMFAYARMPAGGGNTSNTKINNYNMGGVNTRQDTTSVMREFEIMKLMAV
jgi:tape measure domain-containing protein